MRPPYWLLLVVLAACSKAPTEEQKRADQARFDAAAQAAQAEEAEKHRQLIQKAAQAAVAATTPEPPPPPKDIPPAAIAAAPGVLPGTPATGVPAAAAPSAAAAPAAPPSAEDVAIAAAVARVRGTLFDPESMRVRNAQTRDRNSIVCMEVNAKNRFGGMVGFQMTIVADNKVLTFRDPSNVNDLAELALIKQFLELEQRIACFRR